MEQIPLDFNKLVELYNSFGVSKNTKELTTADIINSLIYNNKILDEETLKKLSKIKSITYNNEELKKLIVSQQLKNYLIQELLKVFLQKNNSTELKKESESDLKKESETDTKTEPETDLKTEPETDTKTEPKTDTKKESETDTKKESETDTKTELKTDSKTELKTDSKTNPKISAETIKSLEQSFNRDIEYLNKQKGFLDKIEQIIKSFSRLREKYNL